MYESIAYIFPSLYVSEQYSIVCICHILFTHLSAGGHMDCFGYYE
jgi:hypothetical protein